jgi:hypothetical protein
MIVALALGSTGCGGINATHTVSPASFFMPGLLKADPPRTNAPVLLPENPTLFATVR